VEEIKNVGNYSLPKRTDLVFLIFLFFLPDFRVACLKVYKNFSKLDDFTDEVNWDKTDEIVRKCAHRAKQNNVTLYALGRRGVCLYGKNMTVKYHANDTKNATCNQGIGMEDSIFVYSLGKHYRHSILIKRKLPFRFKMLL